MAALYGAAPFERVNPLPTLIRKDVDLDVTRLHTSCLQQHHLKAAVGQTLAQPLRLWARFKPAPGDRQPQLDKMLQQSLYQASLM